MIKKLFIKISVFNLHIYRFVYKLLYYIIIYIMYINLSKFKLTNIEMKFTDFFNINLISCIVI